MCEDLALCYWAGKAAEVDVFNLQQRSRREPWRLDALIRALDARHFGVAQLEDPSRDFGPRFREALTRNYHVDHRGRWGVLLVPR